MSFLKVVQKLVVLRLNHIPVITLTITLELFEINIKSLINVTMALFDNQIRLNFTYK